MANDERPWLPYLDEGDLFRLERARFGRRIGFGERAALLLIDVQNYMVGPPPGSPHDYPSACGAAAEAALEALVPVLAAARAARLPVVYTRNEFRRDGADIGVYRRKRDLLTSEGWCLQGSEGAQIHAAVAPVASDLVLAKHKPSAFHATPLIGLLIDRGVDTVIVTGGSTSNCVRATAVDSASFDFRTIVVQDCVFDRFRLSHVASLFDLDRQYADVMPSADVINWIQNRHG